MSDLAWKLTAVWRRTNASLEEAHTVRGRVVSRAVDTSWKTTCLPWGILRVAVISVVVSVWHGACLFVRLSYPLIAWVAGRSVLDVIRNAPGVDDSAISIGSELCISIDQPVISPTWATQLKIAAGGSTSSPVEMSLRSCGSPLNALCQRPNW